MRHMSYLLAVMAAVCAIAAVRVTPIAAEVLSSQPIADSAEGAVRIAVETTGEIYAGDCAATVSPRDTSKVCSRFVAEKDGARAYLIGRTFSEFSRWVFIAPADGGWTITGTAALDFFGAPTPPWPGQGAGSTA